MVTVPMVTRPRPGVLVIAVLFGVAALTAGCEKVPLLAPGGSTITLTASTTALPVNGTTQLIAQVIEAGGTPPHRGTQVSFTTTLGTIEPADGQTDANGRVIATFKAGTANGTATIRAISGGASVAAESAVKIAVGTAAVGRVNVSASPSLIPALGGSATITTTVFDINGNPLASAPVTYSTTAGTLDPTFGTTDANGAATTTLRTSTKATVTASVGAQAPATPPSTGTGTTPTTPTSGQASGSVTVDVAGAPNLGITLPSATPTAGLPATFTFVVTQAAANGSAIRSLTVNWGDGTTQELGAVTGSAAVAHTYRSEGSYTITATITDGSGNVVTVSTAVAVNPKLQPAVSIVTTTTNPTAGTDVAFSASVTPAAGGSVITGVTVNFDDGTSTNLGPVSGSNISVHHVFATGGTYRVTLTATDSNGGLGTAATAVFVQTATPLTVLLSATATPAGANTTETFIATVIGLGNSVVVNYHWEFGGSNGSADTSSNQQTRSYAAGSGPFTVTVTVTTSTGAQATGSTVITP
jgi:hypothetical protein